MQRDDKENVIKQTMIVAIGSFLLSSALLVTAASQGRQVVRPGPVNAQADDEC
jgi:hypothetical protein